MRFIILAFVLVSTVPAAAQEQEDIHLGPPPCAERMDAPTPGDPSMVSQFATGVFGQLLGGLLGGGLFALGVETGDPNVALATGTMAILVASAGSVGAVTLVGDSNGGDGTFWAALGGQMAGGVVATLLAMALLGGGGNDPSSLQFWAAFASVVTIPPAGAVIAYDISDPG